MTFKDKEFLESLNNSLISYSNKLFLTRQCVEIRKIILFKTKQLLSRLFEDFEMQTFGSFATDLSLPTSDVDITISLDGQNVLYQISEALKAEKWVSFTSVKYIADAKVPVIKFTSKQWFGGLQVDIVQRKPDGAVDLVNRWREKYPNLQRLVLILKQWLIWKQLDIPFEGGLGGFALINMIVAVISQDTSSDHDVSLARQFLKFFQVFGEKFNFYENAISLDRGAVIKKSALSLAQKQEMLKFTNDGLLIIDPLNPFNNVTKGLFRFPFLIHEFANQLQRFKDCRSMFKFSKTIILSKFMDINIDTITEAQDNCAAIVFNIERVCKGFNFTIDNDSNFDEILKFLRPSRKYEYFDYPVKAVLDSSEGSSFGRISGDSLDTDSIQKIN